MARDFNGTSDFIDCGDPSTVDFGANNYSFAAWIYPDVITNARIMMIMSKDRADQGDRQFTWVINANGDATTRGAVGLALFETNTTLVLETTNADVLSAGVWQHVVGLRNGNDFDVYVNGVLHPTYVLYGSWPRTMQATATQLLIGRRATTVNQLWFDGRICEVGIWNRALIANEIGALAAGAPACAVATLHLVHYWPIWGVASPEADLGGARYNGTVTGTTVVGHAIGSRYATMPRWSPRAAGTEASASASVVWEATQGLLSAEDVRLEALVEMRRALTLPYEAGRQLDISTSSGHESLRVLLAERLVTHEALQELRAQIHAAYEMLQQSHATGQVNYAIAGTVSEAATTAVEALNAMAILWPTLVESTLAIAMSADGQIEALAWLGAASSAVQEAVGTTDVVSTSPVEAVGAVFTDRASAEESLAGLRLIGDVVWEAEGSVRTATLAMIEAAGHVSAALITTHESRGTVRRLLKPRYILSGRAVRMVLPVR